MSDSEDTEISEEIEESVTYLTEIIDDIDAIQKLTRRGSKLWTMCQKCTWRQKKFLNWFRDETKLTYNKWDKHAHHLVNASDYHVVDQLYFDLIDLILPEYENENKSRYKWDMNKSKSKNEKESSKFGTEIKEKFEHIITTFQTWNSMFEFEQRIGPTRWKDIYKTKEQLCCVCLSTEREIVTMPCMHSCLCKGCYDLLEKKSCPLCRKVIKDVRSITHVEEKKIPFFRSQLVSIEDLTSLLEKLKEWPTAS